MGRHKELPNGEKRTRNSQTGSKQTLKDGLNKYTTVEDNTRTGLALGLTKFLMNKRNNVQRPIFTGTTTEDDILTMITEYLEGLEEIPVVYTKNQMTQDLIVLLKSGVAGVGGLLAEMMGYKGNANENFVINVIDYKDIPPENKED